MNENRVKSFKPMWELKQSANPDTLELYIYGDVQGDYFDWTTWGMVESETSANHFKAELAKYPNVKTINLYVNSYGGSVFEGTAIYSQLKRHPAQKIGYVDGFACSIATIPLMACDKVIMPKNTMMMIHNMWTIAAGNAAQLRKEADDLDVIMAGNRQAYLEKSGGKLSEKKLIQMLDEETWLTADDCVKYGLADEILSKEADLTKARQLLQKMNYTLEQQLNYHKSLAAQARELTVKASSPQENKTIKLMAALFN